MGYYVGLDVSLKRTAICIVDEEGALVWERLHAAFDETLHERGDAVLPLLAVIEGRVHSVDH
jgi:hypothetical protein